MIKRDRLQGASGVVKLWWGQNGILRPVAQQRVDLLVNDGGHVVLVAHDLSSKAASGGGCCQMTVR
jgi:hypothetical protein